MFKCHGKSKKTLKSTSTKFRWNEFIKKYFN